MTTAELIGSMLVRDLNGLRRELEAYDDEVDIWLLTPAIPNSAGTLALHLTGNLRHFVGALLGGTGYLRHRDAEFATRDVPRAELLREIDLACTEIGAVMARLTEPELGQTFPQAVAGHQVSTADMLIHLATHLTFHLGQVDYHRRLLGGSARSIGAVAPSELRSATPVA